LAREGKSERERKKERGREKTNVKSVFKETTLLFLSLSLSLFLFIDTKVPSLFTSFYGAKQDN